MKRFLMYVVVLVAILFVGFTTYYFARNNEDVYLNLDQDGTIYLNEGDTIPLPLTRKHPNKKTTYTVTFSKGGDEFVSYNEKTETFTAIAGGTCDITVTCSNDDFGPFKFGIAVGNGKSSQTPLYIWTAEQLAKIGTSDKFASDYHYLIVEDLHLESYNDGVWNPLCSQLNPFNGTLDGINKNIYNLKINSNEGNVGLFNTVGEKGKVENINIVGAEITSTALKIGTIAGVNNGFIGRCSVKNTKITSIGGEVTPMIGGICGDNQSISTRARIDMCESYPTFNVDSGTVGGISGKNSGVIFNSKSEIYSSVIQSSIFGGITAISDYTDLNGQIQNAVIKNTYSIIDTSIFENGCIAGSMIGISYEGEYFKAPVYENNYYATSLTEIRNYAVKERHNANSTTGFTLVEKSDLTSKDTFEGWNFEKNGIWAVSDSASGGYDNVFAYLNYTGSSAYEQLGIYDAGQDITTPEEFKSALEYIRIDPSRDMTFRITKKMTVDMGGVNWIPINNFVGKIIAEKEVIISNFVVDNKEHGGLFGYITGVETLIDGLTFTNVTLKNNKYTGVVAGINFNATIKNCTIMYANIAGGSAGGAKTGTITGINYGVIDNCKVVGQEETDATSDNFGLNVLDFSVDNGDAGFISGMNNGSINDCSVDPTLNNSVVIVIKGQEESNVGFITGKNDIAGNVVNSYVFATKMSANPIASTVIGGLVGINKGRLSFSYLTSAEMQLDSYSTAQSGVDKFCNTLTGGLVGDNSGTIEECFVDQTSIYGYKVGGIAGNSSGTIDKCYIESGGLNGHQIGGLTYNLKGTITNSFANTTLFTINNNSSSAGFSYSLSVGSKIKYCYNYISFIGSGKAYAETITNYKQLTGPGKIENSVCVYDDSMKAYIQKVFDFNFLNIFNWGDWAFGKGGFVGAETDKKVGDTVDPSDSNKFITVEYRSFEKVNPILMKENFSKDIWNFPFQSYGITMLNGMPENTVNPVSRFIPLQ